MSEPVGAALIACASCGHTDAHDAAGIGVCRHPGCGCDGPLSGPTAALVASVHVFQGGACDHKASVCWGECRHEEPPMPDSPRWCARCEQYGDHHTDRCPKFAQAATVAYEVDEVTVRKGQMVLLRPGAQAFYVSSENRHQYGVWHSFVILQPKAREKACTCSTVSGLAFDCPEHGSDVSAAASTP